MEINQQTIIKILSAINSKYPLPIGPDVYSQLATELGSDMTLDGYILYLAEKNLINADMKYIPYEGGHWQVNTDETRINAFGIDYLQTNQM